MPRAKAAHPPRLLLASRSPRRREILERLGIGYRLAAVEIDETPRPGESPRTLARRLARSKAEAVKTRGLRVPILAADTVVTVGADLLGKPLDRADARRMLRRLSGRWHQVVTALAWRMAGKPTQVVHAVTKVRFARLSDDEIERYLNSDEPWDKAGGYALQGSGSWFVRAVDGSVSNVVGLPIEKLRELMRAHRLPLPRLAKLTGDAEGELTTTKPRLSAPLRGKPDRRHDPSADRGRRRRQAASGPANRHRADPD